MAIQTEPTRIQIPFADSGTKNVIPDTNSTPSASQAASWTDGFPAQCSLPLSAGGIPPARADFNGLFNTMSQSIRYGQEGGVWAWDATVDYGTNRLVLGSDGLLYWSVAQSGPNVGGAQNPTTDTGVYWSTMPMRTPSLSDKSSKGATTEWVKNLAVAPVYLDAAGNDTNDGMSAATAVKTFAKALEISTQKSLDVSIIHVASGSYAEDISISRQDCVFLFSGDVTTQNISVDNSSRVWFDCDGGVYTLTLNGKLDVEKKSYCSFNCKLTTVYTANKSISVQNQSTVFLNKDTNVSTGIFVGSSSYVAYTATLTVDVSVDSYNIIGLVGGSVLDGYYSSTLNIQVLAGKTATICIDVSEGCLFVPVNLTINGTFVFTIAVHDNGICMISSSATVSGTVTGKRFTVFRCGLLCVDGAGVNRIPGNVAGEVDSASFGYYG